MRTGAGVQQLGGALEVCDLAVRGQRLGDAGEAGQEGGREQREQESAGSGHGRLRHLSAEKVAVFVAFGLVSAPIAPDDIVETAADAEGNSRPPLLVLAPLRAFLDEHGLGEGELRATPIGEGHSNVTYLIERGEREFVLRRPPRPPLPPSAHNVLREARLLRALRGHAGAGAGGAGGGRRRGDDRRAVLRDGAGRGRGDRHGGARGDRHAGRAQAHQRAADRRARGDPRRRLARGRSGGLRQADRLPGATAAALRRPVGAQQDAGDPRGRDASGRG